MKISFIIPTTGVRNELRACVASIEKAYDQAKELGIEMEIIIVFNGNGHNRAAVNANYPHLTSIYVIREQGLSKARNYGIGKSSGEYLVFLDDDSTVKENILKMIAFGFSNKEYGAICGRILSINDNHPYSVDFKNDQVKYLGYFDFKYFMGSAHVLRKSLIEKIGLYDEEFGAGAKYHAAEENDVFFRLKQIGEKIIYCPEVVFYHPMQEVATPSKKYDYYYGVGAALVKQTINDRLHAYIYLKLISDILFKSFIRSLQLLLFPQMVAKKNRRYQYYSVLQGTIKGIADYTALHLSKWR